MDRDAEAWLADLATQRRAPVFGRSTRPDASVLRRLGRAGAVTKLAGEVIVLRRPGDDEYEVLRRVYWPIVEALLENYAPAVVERDSAVRLLVGDDTPPPVLRVRHGSSASRFEVSVTDELRIVVDAGVVDASRVQIREVAEARVAVDEPAGILFGLDLRFVRDNLSLISLWLRSLVVSRPAVEAAYDEFPRPVVLRRIAHLAEEVGNDRLADLLADVVQSKQRVRIGRGQTGVGRELVVPSRIGRIEPTRRPWLDRLNLQMETFSDQIATVAADIGGTADSSPVSHLLAQARKAKSYDLYHSTSLEGYRLRYEDVSVLLGGRAAGTGTAEEIRTRMAVVGYGRAFDGLLERVREAHGPLRISDGLILDLYVDLFQRSVEAGIVDADLLRGWRTSPVFIRDSRYVPPSADRLGELMPAFSSRLDRETGTTVRAILAHLVFVTIHPLPDGTGRIARLLMNGVLLSGGLPWVTIREDERDEYFSTLKEAQLNDDAIAFAEFVMVRLKKAMAS